MSREDKTEREMSQTAGRMREVELERTQNLSLSYTKNIRQSDERDGERERERERERTHDKQQRYRTCFITSITSLPPSHDKKIYFATIYNCCNCQEIKVVSSTSGRFMSQGFITIKANGSFFSFDIQYERHIKTTLQTLYHTTIIYFCYFPKVFHVHILLLYSCPRCRLLILNYENPFRKYYYMFRTITS